MKAAAIIIISFLFGLSVPAQTTGDCFSPAFNGAYLNINQVNALILPGGNDWFSPIHNMGYEVPKNSGKQTMFSRGLIIGGLDSLGNLRIAGESYRQNGSDFYPGPVLKPGVTANRSSCQAYEKVYKLNKSTVDSMRAHYGQAGYVIPQSILDWPGNGDTSRGEPLKLAPFHDANNNGIYEPHLGEYPGFDYDNTRWYYNQLHGDQVIYKIFNDVGNTHNETQALPLGVEVHSLSYAFSDSSSALGYQTFYDFKIINRSNQAYSQVYLGMLVDFDLGNYFDDLMGTDVQRNLAYVFNGDENDEGLYGYGLNPPSAGVVILKGPLADSNDGIDNNRNGVVDEFNEHVSLSNVFQSNQACMSQTPNNLYEAIQSIGTMYDHLRYGDLGCELNAPEADFIYPGHTDTIFGWGIGGNAQNPNPIHPWYDSLTTDKKAYMGMGPLNFEPGEVLTFSAAVVFGRDQFGGVSGGKEAMFTNSDVCQNVFDKLYANNYVHMEEEAILKLSIYPNPTREEIRLEGLDPEKETRVNLYNLSGALILSEKIKTTHHSLQIGQNQAGVYILEVSPDEGPGIRRKIILLD